MFTELTRQRTENGLMFNLVCDESRRSPPPRPQCEARRVVLSFTEVFFKCYYAPSSVHFRQIAMWAVGGLIQNICIVTVTCERHKAFFLNDFLLTNWHNWWFSSTTCLHTQRSNSTSLIFQVTGAEEKMTGTQCWCIHLISPRYGNAFWHLGIMWLWC